MKRNFDKHISSEAAKGNVLAHMVKHKMTGQSTMHKAGMGYVAYPDYDFRTPQGAAFSVAKIARQMEEDGLIGYRSDGFSRGYYVTEKGASKGMELAAAALVLEISPVLSV